MTTLRLLFRNTSFNLNLISRYRTELMGFAAIGIIACHTKANGVVMPNWLWQIFSLGQLGVSIFFFLSGMGIWFSLKNIECKRWGGVINWYSKRYKKLFVPFLIFAIPFFAYATIAGGHDVWFFVSRITTIEFWLSGGGVWFVSVLVVLYLLSPWWNWLLQLTGWNTLLSAVTFFVLFCFGDRWFNHASEASFYFLGFWLAPYVKEGRNIKWLPIVLGFLAIYIVFRMVPALWSYPRSLFLVPVFVILPCLLFELSRLKGLNKVCHFMGTISLESYLANVFLPMLFIYPTCISRHPILGYGHYFGYLMVVVIGIVLSLVVHQLSDKILSKSLKK